MSDHDHQPVLAETISDAAKAIGVHERTLKSWLAEDAPPKTDAGYDVDAIKAWRKLNRKSSQFEFDDPEEFKLRMAKAKLKEQEGKADKVCSEAVITEFKRQLMSEGLVHKSAVNNYLARVLSTCRNQIQKIPAQLAAGYAPEIQRELERDCSQRIDIVLRALRTQLADLREIEHDD
ncbi:hypothetical protein Enr13x_07110 [Stieleria neptunia]|uniref:Uncharacterized protein n=1 Tax=Stieleria neptunia TaxID=2527979 RepID=A0A518HJ54_9BACT|nr:hypothetical protein [Stieleria neptunia]QDV40875.1 hypothetical protein Enr13x_07110 [Stieleria neptunia]